MANRKTGVNQVNETEDDTPAYTTTTPKPAYQAPSQYDRAEQPAGESGATDGDEHETDEQREAREAAEADHLASNQSGFAQRAELPVTEVAPVVPAALNAAALDGMPVPFDRSTETVIDPHSGAIVSVPVDRDDKAADEKSDDVKKDEDKA
jgi:hypothetical protein